MKKHSENTEKSKEDKNYSLKSDAVEELVTADAGNVPEYSQAELKKYRSKHKFHIPMTVKVLLLKAWFCGAVFFFFFMGLGMYMGDIDLLVASGIALGLVTDLLLNNTIRFIEDTPGSNDKWLMIPPKGVPSMILNCLYCLAILLCVTFLYSAIDIIIAALTGDSQNFLPQEPILFGVFCMGFDMLFIGIKHLIGSIIKDAKNSARSS